MSMTESLQLKGPNGQDISTYLDGPQNRLSGLATTTHPLGRRYRAIDSSNSDPCDSDLDTESEDFHGNDSFLIRVFS